MNRSVSSSLVIAASPRVLYDMISDVTRMGEWSPVCTAGWWDEGQGPSAGSWFTGRNETPERTWETRSLVEAAVPGEIFSFVVGGDRTRWTYRFVEVPGGTEVTEEWEFLPAGQASFEDRFGEDAENQIALREEAARVGIPETLAALRRSVENS
ncbi:MAG: SRPBCC family protein [Acidimicrobiaceae bacterium]|nr:SRPBCC family protein [Acidimicrobiaceae bacterium]